jgi:hypothetical protein
MLREQETPQEIQELDRKESDGLMEEEKVEFYNKVESS